MTDVTMRWPGLHPEPAQVADATGHLGSRQQPPRALGAPRGRGGRMLVEEACPSVELSLNQLDTRLALQPLHLLGAHPRAVH
eukprot:5238340-Alexandrium_andersonii.AAC.1